MKKETDKYTSGNIFEGIISIRTLISCAETYKSGNCSNNRKINTIYFDSTKAEEKAKELSWLKHRAEENVFMIELTDPEYIDRITVGNTHGGLAAECTDRAFPSLSTENVKENGFYVMLEGIEDPYNFGYALRSLYAAGADGVILSDRNWMTAAGLVCRASAGASELLPMFVCRGTDAADLLKARGYKIVCSDLRDSVSIYDADLSLPVFLIIGGEKRGISRSLLDKADIKIRIDYARPFEASLSAASAATITGYEVFRQNR